MSSCNIDEILDAVSHFQFKGTFLECTVYGSGHINDTFLLQFDCGSKHAEKYIFQKMNKYVFPKPKELMENVERITAYLRKKITAEGGNPERETLNLVRTDNGASFYLDPEGEYWRAFKFIDHAVSYDQVESAKDFYESAIAFGHFQKLLSEYPADTLHETIAGFHDTKARLEKFKSAVAADVCKRAAKVEEEIEFVLSREETANVFGDMLDRGEMPLRVTHNDTKLNNIMIDTETGKGICVIDLDTVMPGLTVYDFGDAVRFGASTAAEDETDLNKVSCDMWLYELYMKGFLEGCGGSLTDTEIRMLPMGAKVMTYECGMRFLTDYLEGDRYFKIQKEQQNLDRARTQFKLVKDMEAKWGIMEEMVEKYR